VEEVKVRVTKPPETDEETIARVKSEFVKSAVKIIPDWIDAVFPDGEIAITKGNAGSYHSIKQGEELILFYYYANHWVYGELQSTTSEELQTLKERLSKPDSILARDSQYNQVRFRLWTEEDLKTIQNIIKVRVNGSKE
jgi:hypothetical protein